MTNQEKILTGLDFTDDGKLKMELSDGTVFIFDPRALPGMESAEASEISAIAVKDDRRQIEFTKLKKTFTIAEIIVELVGDLIRSEMARRQGSISSKAKSEAARANGRLGGRPKKIK